MPWPASPPPTPAPVADAAVVNSAVVNPAVAKSAAASVSNPTVVNQTIAAPVSIAPPETVTTAQSSETKQQAIITPNPLPPAPKPLPPETAPPLTSPQQILTGTIERIDIEGTERLDPDYIRQRLQTVIEGAIDSQKLEDKLRVLRLDPQFSEIEASLRPGTTATTRILIIRVKEAPNLMGGASFDNFSPPSVGSERLNAHLGLRNLSGAGDELGGFYTRTTIGGAEAYGLSYRRPLNGNNDSLQIRTERHRTVVKQEPFDALGIRGAAQLYEISYRRPVIQTAQKELALTLGLTVQQGQTFTFNTLPTPFGIGPDEEGRSNTSVLKFTQDYTHRDRQGAWGLRSQFNLGTALFNATRNSGDIPDGQFFSWVGQVQRVQQLSKNHQLLFQGEAQLTNDSLLPSQQLAIGGGRSVRGYRQNARSGDNGLRLSIEDRITLARDNSGNANLQLIPFIDAGTVWNHANNPNKLPKRNTLIGAGAGLLWRPAAGWQARIDYGAALVRISDRGNNLQDHGVHISLGYQF